MTKTCERKKTNKKHCLLYTKHDKTVHMTMTLTLYDSIMNDLGAGEV